MTFLVVLATILYKSLYMDVKRKRDVAELGRNIRMFLPFGARHYKDILMREDRRSGRILPKSIYVSSVRSSCSDVMRPDL
jgi:hypothetical protein